MSTGRVLLGSMCFGLAVASLSAPRVYAARQAAPAPQQAVEPEQGAFACEHPTHHDGDAIRCSNIGGRSMRLYAIDAPEMPGACRPGRRCTPGDPFASRDHLAALTHDATAACRLLTYDHYGRPVVQCFIGQLDLSCAMVRDGFAVERYGRLAC